MSLTIQDRRDVILKEVAEISYIYTDKILEELSINYNKEEYTGKRYELYFAIYTAIKKTLNIK